MRDSDYEAALKHRYRVVHDGPTVPGVTTCIGIIEKPGLKWAAAKLTAKYTFDSVQELNWVDEDSFLTHCAGHFDRVWREKAARGTRVHDVAERWARGEEVSVPLADAGYVDALEAFHSAYRPRFLLIESIVLNPELNFGGRLDFVAQLGDEGTFLCDIKTGGSKRPLEAALQASAYLHGELATYDESGALSGLQPLPKLDGARTIYLRADGTFEVSQPFDIISEEEAWEGFQACLQLFKVHKSLQAKLKGNESAI